MIGISSSLNSTQNALQKAYERLSSGVRINGAADDPAGLAVATSMLNQANGLQQSISNTGYGLAALDTADGALSQIRGNLQQMRDLAVQAGNGTLSASDRQAIQDQMDQLSQANTDIAAGTQSNGQRLLDGTYSTNIQSGPNAGDTLQVSLGDATPAGLGVSALSLSSTTNASSALDAIDNAIGSVSGYQSNIGALQSRLSGNIDIQSSTYENTMAAASRIQDTDYAAATTDAKQAAAKQQAAFYALQQQQAGMRSTMLGPLGIA